MSMQNGQNRDARRFPSRGADVREFAALEFPREDYHWVVAATRPIPPAERGWAVLAGRILRSVGIPRKVEADRDTVGETSATT